MLRLFYTSLLPFLAAIAAPFWLLKTKRRGGLSRRLWEKLARYDHHSPPPTTGKSKPIYIHAVSVGEANIARKLITRWQEIHPQQTFLLALGTSTGFDLALSNPPPQTEILYAPLDFPPFLKRLFTRYQPALIVLIEHEVWPNMMHYGARQGIPIALANARLSPRSSKRLVKLKPLLEKTYRQLNWVGAQVPADVPRLIEIGIPAETIHPIGSIKFDPSIATPSPGISEVEALLKGLGEGPLVMALSTHAGEELLFAKAASTLSSPRIVIVPRHMERRSETLAELTAAGLNPILRSTLTNPLPNSLVGRALIVDSTGELPAFTQYAQVAFIGKSLTARGGQNPCEAISAQVPIIAGPHLGNFEPLASTLRTQGGIATVNNEESLAKTLQELLNDTQLRESQIHAATKSLEQHQGACERTISALVLLMKER